VKSLSYGVSQIDPDPLLGVRMKINKASAWAELLSSIAVVVTLVVLVFEVRATNVALERQAAMDRVSGFTDAFFEAPVLADVLAKIKAVDGTDPIADELMARYGLTSPEAIIWGRHLWVVWSGIEADFMIRGDQPEIRSMVAILKASPDNEIYLQILDYGRHEESFVDYVNAIEPFTLEGS